MERIINEQEPQQQPPSPAFKTLEQKIDELVNGIRGIRDIICDRRKIIRQQLKEIIQLAQDLSIDDMKLRDMIYESCTRMGVSPSWLRKMLPKNLKLTKHTRKDYLKRQQQRDQQPLQQQPQQQQRELVESPTSSSSRHSRHPAVEQRQQPSDNEEKTGAATTKGTTYDDDNHSIAVIPLLTQNENEGLVEKSSDDKNKIIEKLNEKIEELQQEIAYFGEQQQKQQEEKFTAVGYLEIQNNDIPVKVSVNVRTKSIEWMRIARELIQKSYGNDIL
jgi:vacuolar-type H+-ATPase subunit H